MNDESPNSGGHPQRDWGDLLRTYIWVARLRQMHWLSDDWMDSTFLPKSPSGERRRTFIRVRREGNDVEPGSIKRYGYSVVDKIDAHPMFKGSARWYRTPLHQLLIPPGLTAEETTAELHALARRLGLFRATMHQGWVGKAFLPNDKAFECYSEERLKLFTEFLKTRGHIDDVAMLGLLYREAVGQRAFELAVALWAEFVEALMNMGRNLGLPQVQADLLLILAQRRISKDDWSPLILSEQTRQETAEHAVWMENIFTVAGHENINKKWLQQTDLQMLVRQEKHRATYEVAHNWTSVSPELQYLLDNFDKFEATARYRFTKTLSTKIEVMYPTKRGFKSRRVINDLPPRPKGIDPMIAKLNRIKARKKPPT